MRILLISDTWFMGKPLTDDELRQIWDESEEDLSSDDENDEFLRRDQDIGNDLEVDESESSSDELINLDVSHVTADNPRAENSIEILENEAISDSDDDNVPLSVIRRELLQNKTAAERKKMKWRSQVFDSDNVEIMEEEWSVGGRRKWSPYQYFCQYLNEDFWNLTAEQSNIRSMQDNLPPLRATSSEYKKLVGSCIIMGCFKLPRVRMYYKKSLKIPAATILPRDRFFKLRNYIHLVNNFEITEESKKQNRLWKVQPIIDALRRKCTTLPHTKELSIDEQMIPFTGKSVLRQYVKNKPNPVGLKNFVLATPQGLVLDFFVYQGASTWPAGKPEPELGIGGSVVKKLSQDVRPGSTIFMDRYFTSCPLFDYLRERDINAVGTILNKRMPSTAKSVIRSDKDLMKEGRGTFQEIVRQDGRMSITKWIDNRSVLVLSSSEGSLPVSDIQRWDKKSGQYISITRPNCISAYNRAMGGVDLNDRMISYYRMSQRTKKWPVRFIFHCIDLAIVNSWLEYRLDKKKMGVPNRNIMDLLDFKMYIGECLAMDADCPIADQLDNEYEPQLRHIQLTKPAAPKAIPPADVRTSSNKHLPICAVQDKNKFMRCRNKNCKGKTRFQCSTCEVFLCIQPERQCFYEFHA